MRFVAFRKRLITKLRRKERIDVFRYKYIIQEKMVNTLFCMPYAGGSASIYNDWGRNISSVQFVKAIEYAGHGSRYGEDFYSSIEEAADDACKIIASQCLNEYSLYGHSMGCLVALEVALKMKNNYMHGPESIILAASRPPHLLYKDKDLGDLSKNELMQEIKKMGQMDDEIWEYEELYEIISDILFSDIQIFTKYKSKNNFCKLDIPMLVLTGKGDEEAPEKDMNEWNQYTEGAFSLKVLEGNHFFAFNNDETYKSVCEFLRKKF